MKHCIVALLMALSMLPGWARISVEKSLWPCRRHGDRAGHVYQQGGPCGAQTGAYHRRLRPGRRHRPLWRQYLQLQPEPARHLQPSWWCG